MSVTVNDSATELNAMPFSLRYGCNREGVSADERLPSWNRWLYGDVSVRCWGGFPSQLSSDFSVQWLLVVINGAGQREGTQTIALGLWFLGFISFLHNNLMMSLLSLCTQIQFLRISMTLDSVSDRCLRSVSDHVNDHVSDHVNDHVNDHVSQCRTLNVNP